MPIRFRCPHCARLLGIATRKAGLPIDCPQCGKAVTVPVHNGAADLDGLDLLVNPEAAPLPEPARPVAVAPRPRPEAPRPAVATAPRPAPLPKPAPAPPRPKPPRTGTDADPLFEHDDVDALLGVVKPAERFDLDPPDAKAKPVSGMDANSLDDGDGKIVLSSRRATLLVVAVVVLVGAAFAAGFLVALRL